MLAIIMCIIQLQLKHKIGLNLEAENQQESHVMYAQNRQNHQPLIFFFNNKEISVFPNGYGFC